MKPCVLDYTLQQLHSLILESETIEIAVSKLNVQPESLDRYLKKFYYNNKPLTFNRLRVLEPQDVKIQLGDKYTILPSELKKRLSSTNFNEIHKHILRSNSLSQAGIKLGTDGLTLCIFLAKSNLEFKKLQTITPIAMIKQYGEAYYQPLKDCREDITSVSLAQLHAKILHKKSEAQIAAWLGICANTLRRKLVKFSHNGIPLSCKYLKTFELNDIRLQNDYSKQIIIRNKRKKLDASSEKAQQIAPPIPLPVEEWYLTKGALAGFSFFSKKQTKHPDSTLISSSCPAIEAPPFSSIFAIEHQ
ncbi:MAG: hypothetical protein Q8M03_16655 [Legionella sp.]|nr:hypothetical protein [Legionella sp.]